ncbi:hypothetical protein ACIQVA_35925 [Streptomyces microflavus]
MIGGDADVPPLLVPPTANIALGFEPRLNRRLRATATGLAAGG